MATVRVASIVRVSMMSESPPGSRHQSLPYRSGQDCGLPRELEQTPTGLARKRPIRRRFAWSVRIQAVTGRFIQSVRPGNPIPIMGRGTPRQRCRPEAGDIAH